ncbi:cysteine--tRNA ligase [SAR86 cluster bacterium]|jgi:cysteinyl-tRNA synthetase|nr:cysteine--tRNA ligase [SAR86 cluster bacterium]
MKIFNSISSKKEDLVLIEKDRINLYVCGMTVYDDCHIGHARTFISFDLFVRFFSYLGYRVNYVRNITDIEDKIIDKAKLEKVSFSEISDRFIFSMHHDFSKLNLLSPKFEPRASENIPEILEMIEELEAKEFAYSIDGGDVYFDINSYEDYGKLSKRKQKELESGSRVEIDENKKNPNDFVLWKRSEEEPLFDSKWGKGRPGWHIECSAMSKKFLGETFDIHGGGLDLKFPHHENEIAQSECCSGKTLANHWMHVAPLNVNGKKMSKSLGNFVTIKDVLKEYHPEVLRMFFYLTHYRKPINFNENSINDAKNILDKLYESIRGFDESKLEVDKSFSIKFNNSLKDDFNTPKAIKVLQEINQQINRQVSTDNSDLRKLKNSLRSFANSIGLLLNSAEDYFKYSGDLELDDKKIQEAIEERNEARANKNFALADSIRKELSEKGISLEDKEGKTYWKKK